MQVLFDINIVVDLCVARAPFYKKAVEVENFCRKNHIPLRLYTGSVQTMQYVLASTLMYNDTLDGVKKPNSFYEKQSKLFLEEYTKNFYWWSALSEDGPVFSDEDPEDAQLIKAVNRMGNDGLLLTRDKRLLQRFEKAISPEQFIDKYVNAEKEWQIPIPFCDLKKQLDEYRPEMENAISDVIESTSSRDFLPMQKR